MMTAATPQCYRIKTHMMRLRVQSILIHHFEQSVMSTAWHVQPLSFIKLHVEQMRVASHMQMTLLDFFTKQRGA